MKKLFSTLIIVGLLSLELMAGSIIGTIYETSIRSDGSFWVSMKRASDGGVTRTYSFSGSSDTVKAIQATVLSAKITSAPIRLFWTNGQWTRADLLP